MASRSLIAPRKHVSHSCDTHNTQFNLLRVCERPYPLFLLIGLATIKAACWAITTSGRSDSVLDASRRYTARESTTSRILSCPLLNVACSSAAAQLRRGRNMLLLPIVDWPSRTYPRGNSICRIDAPSFCLYYRIHAYNSILNSSDINAYSRDIEYFAQPDEWELPLTLSATKSCLFTTLECLPVHSTQLGCSRPVCYWHTYSE